MNDRFWESGKDICEAFVDMDCPNCYHYTSQDAFLSMIENKKLWLTHYNFMNDSSELEHGFEIFKATFLNLNSQMADDLMYHKDALKNSYVFSCSQNGDSVAMWQTYGKQGLGFSIKPDALCRRGQNYTCLSGPVYYNNDDQNSIAERVCSEICKKGDFENWDYMDLMCALMLLMKPNTFLDEREFRVAAILDSRSTEIELDEPPLKVKWRVINGVICPYIEYPLDPSLIKEVVLSPQASELQVEGLKDFLKSHDMNDCEVRVSNSSFR